MYLKWTQCEILRTQVYVSECKVHPTFMTTSVWGYQHKSMHLIIILSADNNYQRIPPQGHPNAASTLESVDVASEVAEVSAVVILGRKQPTV